MTLELTWGLLIVGVGLSAVLYGISTAQTFFYYRTFATDPLYTRILTGLVWLLNTVHLGMAIHIPWYYLIDGAGGIHDSKIVWTWPMSLIVTVLISLPVYAFYARRIRILGGQLWICIAVLVLGCTHFTLATVFCIKLLIDPNMSAIADFSTSGLIYAAFVVGSVTDVGIALVMCWLLARSRTGHTQTDGIVAMIITYTINSGLLIALCVVASLISGLVAKTTQFELFFLFFLPELYANSYLGSLNNREAIRAHLNARSESNSGNAYALGGVRSQPATPSTVVRIERTTEMRKGDLAVSSSDFSVNEDIEAQKVPSRDSLAISPRM